MSLFNSCDATTYMQIAAAALAAIAALLWFASSYFGLSNFMNTPMGSIDDILKRSGRLNAAAAFFSALAAACQAFLVWMPNCASHFKLGSSALKFLDLS